MSGVNISAQTSRFRIGWLALLVAAVLMTLGHAGLIFALNERTLFVGFTLFNLYAALVIIIPFRRLEKWAWYTTWLLPIGLVIPAIGDPAILSYYFAVGAVCVFGLLVTMRSFFVKG